MLYGNNVVLSTCQTFRFLCLDQTLFFSVASLYVIYLWHHSCLMLYVLAKPGRLLGNAVATESINLVLDGQVLCLLVLVSCDSERMRIITLKHSIHGFMTLLSVDLHTLLWSALLSKLRACSHPLHGSVCIH